MSKPNKVNRVLQDHVKDGKVFVPPFVAAFKPWSDISWHYEILPEVVWIGLLHKKYGEDEGTNMALLLAQSLRRDGPGCPVGFDSEISDTDAAVIESAKSQLVKNGILQEILDAVEPLIRYAPRTGLRFLADVPPTCCDYKDCDKVKAVVRDLLERESRFTVMVQATIVYIAFVLDRLKTMEGLALARFPEISSYPETDISLRIASSVRTSLMMLFAPRPQGTENDWARYFWTQGVEREPCSF